MPPLVLSLGGANFLKLRRPESRRCRSGDVGGRDLSEKRTDGAKKKNHLAPTSCPTLVPVALAPPPVLTSSPYPPPPPRCRRRAFAGICPCAPAAARLWPPSPARDLCGVEKLLVRARASAGLLAAGVRGSSGCWAGRWRLLGRACPNLDSGVLWMAQAVVLGDEAFLRRVAGARVW